MQLLKQLFEGAGLPADFETKAQVVFDAAISEAVASAVEAETVKLAESMQAKLDEAKEAFVTEQAAVLDAFIDQVVSEWAKENAVGIDSQLKSEIAESFLTGLTNLYKEHSVKVLPDTAGVVEGLQKSVADLQAKLDESAAAATKSTQIIESFEKAEVLAELTQGLADTQTGRIAKLAEHFAFTDKESFKQKVTFVVEAVTGKVPAAPEGAKPATPPKEGVEAEEAKKAAEAAEAAKKVEEAAAAAAASATDVKITESTVPSDLVAQTLALMSGKSK